MATTTAPSSPSEPGDADELTAERLRPVLGAVTVARDTALSGGLYNSVRLLELTDGRRLILKTAPLASAPALAHEQGLLGTEALFHRLAAGAGVQAPTVLHHQPSGRGAPAEWLLLSYLDGATWDAARDWLTPADRTVLRRRLGECLARVATVTGPAYGYPQSAAGLSTPDWPSAFTGMLRAVLADAGRFGVTLPAPAAEFAGLPVRFGHRLAEVRRPALVHFDAWEGNIVLARDVDGSWSLAGLIDGERAFFGDPLAELVGLDPLGAAEDDADLMAGYRSVTPGLTVDTGARVRLALYRVYLALVMRVEAAPRAYGGDFASWLDTWSADRLTEQLAVLDTLRAS
ncbi:aminoglycoside phosphotransferase family protein [Streptomyces sp. Je 1-79]|uniref:phosphotransferase family protein n=1 Tax=Streptomyces sp. Je 1-79 TaxID=2943847 RepID=UPI0021A59241|nr:aminoglycoside phosphotransferase family protein [Streptomyces sp. Je 1-79]MCT4352260.1 aminoglycoside phosphotransferase family protein [Streptomyces sp. Je 1-79]